MRSGSAKETYVCCKRDLHMLQKRPTYNAKETYICCKRDLLQCKRDLEAREVQVAAAAGVSQNAFP